MHVTRLVAELAGLTRKYKGKFILGRECRKLLTGNGCPANIYPRLFLAFVEKYNWGYQDRYPGFPVYSAFISFHLLSAGQVWRRVAGQTRSTQIVSCGHSPLCSRKSGRSSYYSARKNSAGLSIRFAAWNTLPDSSDWRRSSAIPVNGSPTISACENCRYWIM